MDKVNTYLIKWYGPFKTRQLMKEWEDSRSEKLNYMSFMLNRKARKIDITVG